MVAIQGMLAPEFPTDTILGILHRRPNGRQSHSYAVKTQKR